MTKKVVFASTSQLELLQPELNVILYEIALLMKEPEETVEDWLSFCFVSDEARLNDLIYGDDVFDLLKRRLDLPDLSPNQFFIQIASELRKRRTGS